MNETETNATRANEILASINIAYQLESDGKTAHMCGDVFGNPRLVVNLIAQLLAEYSYKFEDTASLDDLCDLLKEKADTLQDNYDPDSPAFRFDGGFVPFKEVNREQIDARDLRIRED